MKNVNTIGIKIKKLRKGKGLTAEELGRFLGVSQQHVSRYERGVSLVNIDILIKLSFIFKVTIGELTKN
ncbi:helix-turn-helix transcriptional regulator (plasmid) [Providencia sp. R33]|uniref:helix-turn-helix domain-containing protein n=1 Tax=Providencia sp. R33 TaxID=2828763 RepID=UPI001C5BF48C|nr:helix-turn-helix transcriptional regulator [Providencia sp. R33]QXX85182.1 helix-turn-helix transcriptional regulator [Providencia sp. R33]